MAGEVGLSNIEYILKLMIIFLSVSVQEAFLDERSVKGRSLLIIDF